MKAHVQTKNGKKPTVSDIAKAAGVSAATVSRVLSGSDYPVKKDVRKRILHIASSIKYKPNIFGQMLRGGTNREIGVIVPSLSNPFYAQLVSVVEHECIKRDYMPIICSSQNKSQLEEKHLDILQRKQVAGFLLSSIHVQGSFLKTLRNISMPLVLFDQPYNYAKTDNVSFDFLNAGYMAAQFLFANGHKDIAFVSGPFTRFSRKLLFEGYKKTFKEKHTRFPSENLIIAETDRKNTGFDYDFHCGQYAGDLLLQRKYLPDAVFAVNDMMAIGLIKKFEKEGIQVPRDISVIGCDNIPFGEMFAPALTTINQSAFETGRLATDVLLNRIEGKSGEIKRILLPPRLIERESVRKIHHKIKR
ncbi:LacI family DNA-binding transcriptional regulator [Treponema sp. OMZ 840]|uniref:LacI family DNA-binding transcriptional regulator n=1 Tax=Treponema sp. OMZ 840 TaxID=244313 RepID=UPI003D8E2E3F